MISVFIADDHAVVRHGIEQILKETSDMGVSGEAEDTAGLTEKIRKSPTDVLILDVSMPGRGGFEALRELRQAFPALPILVFSMHAEEQFAVRAIKAGASGYLSKSASTSELIDAIRKVQSGRRYLSPEAMERLADDMGRQIGAPVHEALSDREFQVASAIVAGKRPATIAEELSLSVTTVHTHRARVLAKMYMRSTADLIRYFLENKLAL